MYKIVSLFGSVYLMSTSLRLLNMTLLEKKIRSELIIINSLTFLVSSFIFYKSSRLQE